MEDYPDYCRQCHVGDYLLQIMAAMKEDVYFFNDIMSVYRIDNSNSWMSNQNWSSVTESNLKRVSSMINMFDGFLQAYPKYRITLKNKIASYLIFQCPTKNSQCRTRLRFVKQYFSSYYKGIPAKWKMVALLKSIDIPKIRGIVMYFLSFIFKYYSDRRLVYM